MLSSAKLAGTPIRAALLVSLLSATVVAQAAAPDLGKMTPTGAQRGTEVEVLLEGARLGDAQQLLFFEPGLTVASLEPQPPNAVKVRLAIAPNCRLGMHPLRVRTASGISNLRTFSVGALAEANEVEPNNEFTAPQTIALDTTVNGVIKNEDVDYFLVEAKKGERITAEVEGVRIYAGQSNKFFDPYIGILNMGRFELARSDDAPLLKQDAVASIIAPEDGTYVIQLRDSSYDGSDRSHYRLHVGRFPRPTAVLPTGGRPGETLEVRWLGDVTGERVETVALPPAADVDFALIPRDERGIAPSGVPFRLVDFGNVIEAEPNDQPASATPFTAPLACNGVLSQAGDIDYFKFHGAKGQQVDVRVFARSLGSPLDSVIGVHRADGGGFGGNDDSGSPDSYLRATLPDDGDFLVSIHDHLKQGGPDYIYRIEVTPIAPSLELKLPERTQYVDTTLPVPQGNYLSAMVSAKRADFGGDLLLELKDLPPGVSVEAVPMPGNRSETPVMFSAAADAALAGALVDLTGHRPADAQPPATGGFHQRTELVRGQNNREVWGCSTRRMPLAVTQAVPFKIDIVEPKVPLVRGGSMNLKVVATRQEGFKAPIAVRMLYNPPGVGSSGSVSIPEGQNEAFIPLTGNGDAELQKWKIAVLGEAPVGDGPILVSSPFATLEVAEPYLAFAIQSAAVEQGKEVDLVINVEKKKDFEGVAKIELLGVPNEVTAPPQEINRDATQVVFHVKTTDKSPAGRHKGVLCRAVITLNDEPITHTLGPGELRIDTPLPAPVAAAPTPAPAAAVAAAPAPPAEKRLTRLEQLRLGRQQAAAEAPKP